MSPRAAAAKALPSVQQAIRAGLGHVGRAQRGDHWRGFSTLAGESDVWVTAFIVAHLQALAKRPLLGAAKAYLRMHCSVGGMWSYGGAVPPDADSTAWSLMALSGARDLPAAQRECALQGLWQQQLSGGVATYAADGAIAAFIGAGAEVSLAGWTAPHPDVTAAAVLATTTRSSAKPTPWPADNALAALIARQSAAGFIDAYWWRGPHYTTTLVLRALSARRRRLEPERAQRILNALEREQLADGGYGLGAAQHMDPFTTAMALESLTHLAYLGGAPLRRAAVQSLLRTQTDAGAWAGEYILRIPAPGVIDPRGVTLWTLDGGGGNSYVRDRDGLFATTLACHALERSHSVELDDQGLRQAWPVLAAAAGLEGEALEVRVSNA